MCLVMFSRFCVCVGVPHYDREHMHRCHIIYNMDPPDNVLQLGLGNTLHFTSELGWEASFCNQRPVHTFGKTT